MLLQECKWIRLNGQLIKEGDWSYLDTAVGLCNKYGLKIIMVIDIDRSVSLEYITLMCETYARRYNGEEGRGYVDYFQVWNEVDIDLLQAKYGGSSPGGELETHYYTVPADGAADLPEYLEYFEAAEKGIHSKDSNSKFMINFSARHCGMISYFLRNGLKIDMVGNDLDLCDGMCGSSSGSPWLAGCRIHSLGASSSSGWGSRASRTGGTRAGCARR